MGTRGQGGYKLEAPRPRGSVDQGTHLRVSGRGWSGNRYGFPGSGTGAGLNLYLVLNTRTRDLRMAATTKAAHGAAPTRGTASKGEPLIHLFSPELMAGKGNA